MGGQPPDAPPGYQWALQPLPPPREGGIHPGPVGWLLIIAVLIVAGLSFLAFLSLAFPVLSSDCTVQMAGFDANVESVGFLAGRDCGSLENDGFVLTNHPYGTIICRVELHSRTLTVRDSGALDLFGHAECDSLEQQGGTPK
jgi:hypothetical protein